MPPRTEVTDLLFPMWFLEQDFMVFLSFFGWTLLGLLAWTKPLRTRQDSESHWFWFGYFAFAEAMADFVRTLSFSDPFFRTFSIEVPLEMVGLGCLIEASLRSWPRYGGRGIPPYIAIACGLLGFAIEVSPILYSLVVAFLVSAVACLWFAWSVRKISVAQGRPELTVVFIGVLILIPAWILHPDHMAYLRRETLVSYNEFPFYGFILLFLRILSAWLALTGFWIFRLRTRMEDVGDQAREKLRVVGIRTLPCALVAIILASYLATTWNGRRERERIDEELLSLSRTAALAVDSTSIEAILGSEAGSRGQIESELRKIAEVGSDVDRVYAWNISSSGFDLRGHVSDNVGPSVVGDAYGLIAREDDYLSESSFVFGPFRVEQNLYLNVSSPLVHPESGMTGAWLGIDIRATEWLRDISVARLQTIIIAGLVLALIIFFLFYQIENESETDLALAKERAEAADRAKSEFLAVISHEIRTPLQSVLGYSNLLRNTRLDEKQMACLDTIQSEGKILLRIVQDILDFSNLRKASSELKVGSVRLKALIEETYRTIRPMAEKKSLAAELEVGAGLPAVIRTDGVRLRQALLNLFGNSVKYTDRGSVKLAIHRDSSSMRPGALVFAISDTGVGIKKGDLERLFEPFIQLEHVGTSPREGAGLGLAIVKRIVELMGGTISVRSEFGKGSEFKAIFDFDVESMEEPEPDALKDLKSLRSRESMRLGEEYPLKILVADDNPMVRRLITLYLEGLGYEPDQVDDGKPVAERGASYDLIISDLRMPGMDGPTAAEAVRRKAEASDRPWIIGVSATLAETEIERAMNAGINDFLGKPFFEHDLEERIRSIPWIEQAASEQQKRGEDSPDTVDTSFIAGGMGVFSDEMIDQAMDEARSLCRQMEESEKAGDFDFVREKAHYLANTAMALGIEALYADSKALQKAAEEKSSGCEELIAKLRSNLAEWERSR